MRFSFLSLLLSVALAAAEPYTGPRPPKDDVPFLVHADNLVETETGSAAEETKKDATVARIKGASSSAKTPLSEPIFLLKSTKIVASTMSAFKLNVKDGMREVTINHRKEKNVARPIHTVVTRLDDGLYRIEIDEPLANGEYTLSPEGSDQTFSFAIY